MKNFTRAASAALILAVSGQAAAIPLLDIVSPGSGDWIGPDALPLGGSHDVAETQGAEGWYSSNLVALEDVALTFTYLGKEAGWTNIVETGGVEVFNTATSVAGDTADGGTASAGAYIDFVIAVLAGGNAPASVANGSNVDPQGVQSSVNGTYGAPNFWLGYANEERTSVYVAFDDGGGNWMGNIDDDNHDDLVFRIDAVAVPEPGILSLLGAGLIALGFTTRRRRRNSM